MPFVKRKSGPVRISQVELTKDLTIRDELECIANHAMCCIMQQLSTLSHHASDMFDDLSSEAKKISNRTEKLRSHVNELKEKYKKFNKKKPGESSITMEDHSEKKLSKRFDQQLLSPKTRPVPISNMYDMANPPPAFDKVNQFRDDGVDGLTLYTNPKYFFMCWSSQMQQKQMEHEGKRLKRDKKAKGQDGKNGPRQVKRKQDQLVQRAKGEEFDPNFKKNHEHDTRKRKKKKKKMEGFSNRQWEKQHPNQRLDKVEEVHEAHPENQESLTTEDLPVTHTPVDVIEENNNETKREDIPPPVPMRKHAQVTEERESIPPPPPPVLEDNYTQGNTIQSVAFPPTPYEFYQQTDGRDSEWLPPPPLVDKSDNTNQDFRESVLPPPPPQEAEEVKPLKNLKAQRISTFILPPPLEDDRVGGRQCTPPPDYPLIDESPETAATSVPQPPPPPPPPPPNLVPTSHRSTENSNIDPEMSVTPRAGLQFDSNSLLSMKQNLKQSKERKVEPVKHKQDSFDVHSIMAKALDRKFKKESSSEEESDESDDSDSDWD